MQKAGNAAGTAHQVHRTMHTALNEAVRRWHLAVSPRVYRQGPAPGGRGGRSLYDRRSPEAPRPSQQKRAPSPVGHIPGARSAPRGSPRPRRVGGRRLRASRPDRPPQPSPPSVRARLRRPLRAQARLRSPRGQCPLRYQGHQGPRRTQAHRHPRPLGAIPAPAPARAGTLASRGGRPLGREGERLRLPDRRAPQPDHRSPRVEGPPQCSLSARGPPTRHPSHGSDRPADPRRPGCGRRRHDRWVSCMSAHMRRRYQRLTNRVLTDWPTRSAGCCGRCPTFERPHSTSRAAGPNASAFGPAAAGFPTSLVP
ncbi:hypothetical protein GA0115251_11828 [Streptomyces sp. TverLS-915]|nr:hypothetical protein GA0115251_11828 [Streptomyces sp. TverLS-915]